MNILKHRLLLILAFFIQAQLFSQSALSPVDSFGSNPGNLKMYTYIPAGLTDTAPLVVVLHGCTQSASLYSNESGWNKLADRHQFRIVYPEQQAENNSALCFNWFDSLYQMKDQFEVLSIRQMIEHMNANYLVDSSNIFISGLSAGGGMSSVMLANYPEIFNKGAIMAGIPFRASSDTASAFTAMGGSVTKTPEEWGGLVKDANPGYVGEYPDVAIFHGGMDALVNLKNATGLIKQWTNVNGADTIPDFVDSTFQGDTAAIFSIYKDSLNNPVVYYYEINGMAHGISIDTGLCPQQGGSIGTHTFDYNFHSTYWAADFFKLIQAPYLISGKIEVSQDATNVNYTVISDSNSFYFWSVPDDAIILNGQGTASIDVNFGINSGLVSVQERTLDSCLNDPASLFITVLDYRASISQTSFINCNGDSTAALTASVIGGNGPYAFNWMPGNLITDSIQNLKAGSYTLTVKDKEGFIVSTISETIEEPALIFSEKYKTLCAGQSDTVGTSIYTISGNYMDTLTSFSGCDSLVINHLTILPENVKINTLSKCFGERIFVGSNEYGMSGTYTDTFTSFQGCDSSIITQLTILPENKMEQIKTICANENWKVGDKTYNSTGSYTEVLTSFQGCDSIVNSILFVEDPIDVSLNFSAVNNRPTLSANAKNEVYQWLNCDDDFSAIPAANTREFTVTENGNYALSINSSTCADTSECYAIVASTIADADVVREITLYPNPFSNQARLHFNKAQRNVEIRWTDLMGNTLRSTMFSGTDLILEKKDLKAGIYLIHIVDKLMIIKSVKVFIR